MTNFDAKGQVVFIEPDWVIGKTCLWKITNPIEYSYARGKLTKIRKDFILRLEKENFVITFDRNYDKDTICLVMDGESLCSFETDETDYKKLFDECIAKAGGENFNYPKTMKVEEYFKNPFFPSVFKNESANGGIDKFLIENEKQLEVIKKIYSNVPQLKEGFKSVIFQQLIEPPTKYKTYLRVLMGASGDVLGASLKYSKKEERKRQLQGVFEKLLWDENSPYYVDCQGMFNYYSGGGDIYFNQPRYSTEKEGILEAHGINPDNPQIPSEVLEVAKSIITKCNRQLGVICGMDFIFNEIDKKWYYLENQAFPAIEEWANERNIKVNSIKSIDDYIKYLSLELETRRDALIMYMNKKLSDDNKKMQYK